LLLLVFCRLTLPCIQSAIHVIALLDRLTLVPFPPRDRFFICETLEPNPGTIGSEAGCAVAGEVSIIRHKAFITTVREIGFYVASVMSDSHELDILLVPALLDRRCLAPDHSVA
jgi:hypothetical protein